jgi:hypothetical protein
MGGHWPTPSTKGVSLLHKLLSAPFVTVRHESAEICLIESNMHLYTSITCLKKQ